VSLVFEVTVTVFSSDSLRLPLDNSFIKNTDDMFYEFIFQADDGVIAA